MNSHFEVCYCSVIVTLVSFFLCQVTQSCWKVWYRMSSFTDINFTKLESCIWVIRGLAHWCLFIFSVQFHERLNRIRDEELIKADHELLEKECTSAGAKFTQFRPNMEGLPATPEDSQHRQNQDEDRGLSKTWIWVLSFRWKQGDDKTP